jgi:hypothetical protein
MGMSKVYNRCAGIIGNWCLVNRTEDVEKMRTWAGELEKRSASPPKLTWETPKRRGTSSEFSVSDDQGVRVDLQGVNDAVIICNVIVNVDTALS